jgi:hypothetical protein
MMHLSDMITDNTTHFILLRRKIIQYNCSILVHNSIQYNNIGVLIAISNIISDNACWSNYRRHGEYLSQTGHWIKRN